MYQILLDNSFSADSKILATAIMLPKGQQILTGVTDTNNLKVLFLFFLNRKKPFPSLQNKQPDIVIKNKNA